MPEKFDFKQLNLSYQHNQDKFDEKFENLTKDEQMEVVDEARIDALEFPIIEPLADYKNDNQDDRIAKALANRDKHGMSEEIIRSAIEKSVIKQISYGDMDYVKKILAAFRQSEDIFKTPRAKEAALEHIGDTIRRTVFFFGAGEKNR